MKLKAYKTIVAPDAKELSGCGTIVIESREGHPLVVAVEHEANGRVAYCTVHAGEDDFNTVLRNIGYEKVTVCEPLSLVSNPDELGRLPNLM